MTTSIDVINLALIDIGQTPVQSLGTPPGDRYKLQYDTQIGALVSAYPWTFQTQKKQLARLTAAPELHWQYAYDLPAELRGALRAVYPNKDCKRPTRDFELGGRQLLADHPELWIRFTGPVNPALWPDYFAALAVLVMKAQFALSVREDVPLWRELTEQVYGPPHMMGESGKLAEAKAIDASGKPSDVLQIGSNPLVAVRVT